jgi:hypothetical protein
LFAPVKKTRATAQRLGQQQKYNPAGRSAHAVPRFDDERFDFRKRRFSGAAQQE